VKTLLTFSSGRSWTPFETDGKENEVEEAQQHGGGEQEGGELLDRA